MNQSLLSIGIILSLGSVGCAGVGLQPSSSLRAEYGADQGIDALWTATQTVTPEGAEPPLYADQELGSLWDAPRTGPSGVVGTAEESTRGADLWNPATVTRSWEPAHQPSRPAYRLSRSGARIRF
jgi:hypothetical protein